MSRQFRTESDDLNPTLDRSPADATAVFARAGIRIDTAGREHPASPRERLALMLRNMHLSNSREQNRRDDELACLTPRDKLAVETRDMWKGNQ